MGRGQRRSRGPGAGGIAGGSPWLPLAVSAVRLRMDWRPVLGFGVDAAEWAAAMAVCQAAVDEFNQVAKREERW